MVVVSSQGTVVDDTQYFLRLLAALCAQNGECSCKQRESANCKPWINFGSLVGFWLSIPIMIMVVPRISISKCAHSKSQGKCQECILKKLSQCSRSLSLCFGRR